MEANVLSHFVVFNLVFALTNAWFWNDFTWPWAYGNGHRSVKECCRETWISLNTPKLYFDLNQRVYGQHLASGIVYRAIKGHLDNKKPRKALALSFNGMAGTGKSFVSKIIADNIYAKGIRSEYVKLIIGSHDFIHTTEWKNDVIKLRNMITETVAKCPRSLFIFDEIEKMNPELVDVLKPFLSHYPEIKGVDYRKAIFIFVGNTGAELIKNITILNKKNHRKREEITIKQMDKVLSEEALNDVGGFFHSTLLRHQLIDYFIPFLPLEKSHVKLCIEDDLREKDIVVPDVIEYITRSVLNEMEYFPEKTEWFSESSCHKVSSKVDQYIDKRKDRVELK